MGQIFEIKAYTPKELGQLYFPEDNSENSGRNSWRKVKNWIDCNQTLKVELTSLGLTKGIKVLTPRMVKLIVEAFGEP